MIVIFTGLPGAGKSLKMAKTMVKILYRNRDWYNTQMQRFLDKKESKMPILRKVYSNLKLSPEVEKEFLNERTGLIKYWTEPSELVAIRDADVFWDEIATHLDSTQWQNMSLELKRWLQQHRKFGIEIYGTTQDFAMIDKSMRRLTSDLYILTKLIGSRDKSTTKPDVKHIWGVSMLQNIDPQTYDEEKKKQAAGIPWPMWISKGAVDIFDTTQEIKAGKYPPLNHIERECGDPNCTFHKVIHA